jgi:hypothetical protein
MQDMLNQMKDITIAGSMVTIRSCMKESDVKNMEMLAEEILAEE